MILLSVLIVTPIQWALDDKITSLPGGPKGRNLWFICAPSFPIGFHHGALAIMANIKPSHSSKTGTTGPLCPMQEVQSFVQFCAISKAPRQRPAGKLLSLLVPHCPWSHLGVNFKCITNLPASDSICILVD